MEKWKEGVVIASLSRQVLHQHSGVGSLPHRDISVTAKKEKKKKKQKEKKVNNLSVLVKDVVLGCSGLA